MIYIYIYIYISIYRAEAQFITGSSVHHVVVHKSPPNAYFSSQISYIYISTERYKSLTRKLSAYDAEGGGGGGNK